MNIWPVIKAPIAVQLNRIAFALYVGFFGSFLWRVHSIASVEGTAIFLGMIFFCVPGLFYSFVRARRSRWIMAALGLLIPGLVFTSMCLLEFSRPEGLSDWFLFVLAALVYWFAIPIMLALLLFKSIYNISFEKRGLVVDIGSAQKCLEYFTRADDGSHAGPRSVSLPGK
jgi:amino acid transporter